MILSHRSSHGGIESVQYNSDLVSPEVKCGAKTVQGCCHRQLLSAPFPLLQ